MGATVAAVIRSRGDHRLLEAALHDVRGQTRRVGLVVLAVDHADDAAAAERLAEADPAVVVVRASGRAGLANAALAAVDTDHVVLHDDDGSWRPAFLEETVAFLDAHPDHVAVATRAEVVQDETAGGRDVLAGDESAVSLTSLLGGNYVPPSSLLFRRAAAEAVGRYDEELPTLEDWEFLIRLVAHGPVGFLADVPLAAWHPGSPADERVQRAAELLVRDRVLRRDLTGKEPGGGGLGILLALSDQLSAATERWGRAHQDHLDAVTTEQRIELRRVRGEVLLMRELLTELQEDIAVLGTQVEETMARSARALELVRDRGSRGAGDGLARRAIRRLTRRYPPV